MTARQARKGGGRHGWSRLSHAIISRVRCEVGFGRKPSFSAEFRRFWVFLVDCGSGRTADGAFSQFGMRFRKSNRSGAGVECRVSDYSVMNRAVFSRSLCASFLFDLIQSVTGLPSQADIFRQQRQPVSIHVFCQAILLGIFRVLKVPSTGYPGVFHSSASSLGAPASPLKMTAGLPVPPGLSAPAAAIRPVPAPS